MPINTAYDPEQEETTKKPAADGSHDDLGVSPEQRDQETGALGNLYNAESAPEGGIQSSADTNEASRLDDRVGKGYTGDNKSQKPEKSSGKRNKIFAGVAVTMSVGLGTLGILQGPNFVINQLREVLLTKISGLQNSHARKYRRSKLSKATDIFSKDGRRGGKIIAEMEARGYKFHFDKNNKTRIVGLELPNGRGFSNLDNGALAAHIEDYLEIRHPLRTSKWKTKRMEAFYGRYKVSRKAVVAPVDGDDTDPDKTVNKRMAEELIDEGPEERVTRPDGEDDPNETDEDRAAREAREAEIESLAKSDDPLESTIGKLKQGESVKNLDIEEQAVLSVSSNLDDEVVKVANAAAKGSALGRAWNSLKGLGNSTDILDKVCTVKKRLDSVVIAARHYRSIRLLKYASVFVSASDATRTGNVDPKLMNSLMKRVTAVDRNGQSLGASPGFAYALKNKFSKGKNTSFKGTYGVDGQLGGAFKGIQDATENIPGTSPGQCRVIQNPAFQIGVVVLEIVGAVFSGGTSAGVSTSMKTAVKEAVKKVVSKQMAKSLLKSLVVELSFEGAMALVQLYAEKSLAVDFTGQEQGGELGGILTAGAGVMHKQRGLQGGMVPATPDQYAEAQSEYITWKADELSKQSFFARTFDIKNPDSVAFNAASSVATMQLSPSLITRNFSYTVKGFLSGPFAVINSVLASFTSTAFAQDADLIAFEELDAGGKKLATDHAGNALPIMRNDIANIDPESNKRSLIASGDIDATTLEPTSANFTGHVANCVDEVDILSTIEKSGSENDPKTDCLAKLGITQKYKAHLAYLDMLDTLDSSLFPDEVSTGSAQSSQNTSVQTPGGSQGDTSAQTCPTDPDISDAGTGDKYGPGRVLLYKIRLCKVRNTTVNVTIAANLANLLRAADNEGVVLGGSGYRTYDRQKELRAEHGCPDDSQPPGDCTPDTARPGTSNHEDGNAVDFTDGVDTCRKNQKCFSWLSANANKYNFFNLPSESWHWSINGK